MSSADSSFAPAGERPLLLVDVDGVIALFGMTPGTVAGLSGLAPVAAASGTATPEGTWHQIEGFPYFLSGRAAGLLEELAEVFELVWCTGWEDRANDHLPRLLGVPAGLPVIRFERNPGRGNAHWKLAAIDAFAGNRVVAWIDDALDERCHQWAVDRTTRGAATLLVETNPHEGITRAHLSALLVFAASFPAADAAPGG